MNLKTTDLLLISLIILMLIFIAFFFFYLIFFKNNKKNNNNLANNLENNSNEQVAQKIIDGIKITNNILEKNIGNYTNEQTKQAIEKLIDVFKIENKVVEENIGNYTNEQTKQATEKLIDVFKIENKVVEENIGNLTDKKNKQVMEILHSVFKIENKVTEEKINEHNDYGNKEIIKNISELLEQKIDNLSQTQNKTFNQLNQITNIFINNKAKGNLGEQTLEAIFTDMYGSNDSSQMWNRQEKDLSSGGVVDFSFKITNTKKIAIDSKFPTSTWERLSFAEEKFKKCFENSEKESIDIEVQKHKKTFINDIKKMADDVNRYVQHKDSQYILGVVYIPSEGIYNYLLENFYHDVTNFFKNKKKIIFVSPITLNYVLLLSKSIYEQDNVAINLQDILNKIKDYHKNSELAFERWDKIQSLIETSLIEKIKKFNTSIGKLQKDYNKIKDLEEKKIPLLNVE